jgi:hypothetical protein
MLKLTLAFLILGTSLAHAENASIVAFSGYGGLRSLGPEAIEIATKQIKYECLVLRRAELKTKINCVKFEDGSIYRVCSAVCSTGKNAVFLGNDLLPNVTK